METNKPPDFDWVRARHACSVVGMFTRLKAQAERDVTTRNTLRQDGEPLKFVFHVGSEWRFTVAREGNSSAAGVDFAIEKDRIEIRTGATVVTATVTLTDAAECKLKIGADELDPWQVLRRALEPLFFG